MKEDGEQRNKDTEGEVQRGSPKEKLNLELYTEMRIMSAKNYLLFMNMKFLPHDVRMALIFGNAGRCLIFNVSLTNR